MYKSCSAAAAEVTFLHGSLIRMNVVRGGGSFFFRPDQGRRGDQRIIADQQRTSERGKEREGGREKQIFLPVKGPWSRASAPGVGLKSSVSHLSRNRRFLEDGEGDGVETHAGRTSSACLLYGFRTVLTAVKVIQSNGCAVVGFQRINMGLCVWLIWREASKQKLYLK